MSAARNLKMGLYTNISVLPDRPMSRPLTRETVNSVDSSTLGGKSFTTATFDTFRDSSAFYDWPDLPPIEKIKEGIVRSRVSKGISYLLPVEKSKNSIETNFQTDLRAMFTEPYTSAKQSYDEARTVASARHHLTPNTAMSSDSDRRVISRIMSPEFERDMKLNSDSEKARRSYSRSAPARAKTKTQDHKNLKQRSNLFIPLKAKIPPELLQLKEEAEKILQSVQEKDDDDDDSKQNEPKEEQKPDKSARKSSTGFSFFSDPFSQDMSFMTFDGYGEKSLASGQHQFVRSTERAGIKRYKDFEKIKGPVKPAFPEELRSPYLNDDKNDQIWDWLVEGEKIDEFDYFLSVCG
ncbi:uncharacterized protein LOC135489774 [Lineus longissimus]|uniref:uncharacterized protein LOC135489774 n=1 Tax=Lineus longissimus TaxID=88925 RepID=UPI00315D5CB8